MSDLPVWAQADEESGEIFWKAFGAGATPLAQQKKSSATAFVAGLSLAAAAHRAPGTPSTKTDVSTKVARLLCPPFDYAVLSDVNEAVAALRSPILAPIPVERIISVGSGMVDPTLFINTRGEEACDFINAFSGFEVRIAQYGTEMSKEFAMCSITNITGMFWAKLSSLVGGFGPMLSYNYNTTDERPDETVFLNDFLASKGEHKRSKMDLMEAIQEQKEKLAGFNHVEYGPHIACLPVYSACGEDVEFGIVDVRTRMYRAVSRFTVTSAAHRCACFTTSINIFRMLRTMAPYIPTNASPIFQVQLGLTFFCDYVLKDIPETCTCPSTLYELLATGSVPCAATVRKVYLAKVQKLSISPVGVRTPDGGQGLSLSDVRVAVRDCLTCVSYLHARGFVHRDIRWANLIRLYDSRPDGSVEAVHFHVIDFEFSGLDNAPMDIENNIFRDHVPLGEPYSAYHDLYIVGKLIVTWATTNGLTLDQQTQGMVDALQSGTADAAAALNNPWLSLA